MLPLTSVLDCPPCQYKVAEYRPLTDSGMLIYGAWLALQNWNEIYLEQNSHKKAEIFQETLMNKFYELFPLKTFKVCSEDRPWFSATLKVMDRKRKREFSKNQKSKKWYHLNQVFEEKCKEEKANYYQNIVADLKTSKPAQWYSKVKRMAGQNSKEQNISWMLPNKEKQ